MGDYTKLYDEGPVETTSTISRTTELNRRIAKAKEYTTAHPRWSATHDGEGWCDPEDCLYDGFAWADSADVALAELLPDLLAVHSEWDVSFERDEEVFFGKYFGPTLAIAICEAWLAVKGAKDE